MASIGCRRASPGSRPAPESPARSPWPDGHTATRGPLRQRPRQNGIAKIERSTIVYPGNPKVGLAPRTDAAPTPDELDAAFATETARLLALGAAGAPTQAAGEFDARAAAAADPLEKLQWAIVLALRSTRLPDAEAADALSVAVLETKLSGKALVSALAQGARMPVPEAEPAPATSGAAAPTTTSTAAVSGGEPAGAVSPAAAPSAP